MIQCQFLSLLFKVTVLNSFIVASSCTDNHLTGGLSFHKRLENSVVNLEILSRVSYIAVKRKECFDDHLA